MTACAFCPHHCPPRPRLQAMREEQEGRTCMVCGDALTGKRVLLCGNASCAYEYKKAHRVDMHAVATTTKHVQRADGKSLCGKGPFEGRMVAAAEESTCRKCQAFAKVVARPTVRTHLLGKEGRTLCGHSHVPLVKEKPTCFRCAKGEGRWRRG